jgi:hypothetical protein
MMHSGRRLLYTEERVIAMMAAAVRKIRGDEAVAHFETMVELRRLQVEVRELHAVIGEMRAARLAVEKAEADLELLRRDAQRRAAMAEGKAVWLH